jgi:hypothetical protein
MSWPRESRRKFRSAAPGWQGATTEGVDSVASLSESSANAPREARQLRFTFRPLMQMRRHRVTGEGRIVERVGEFLEAAIDAG